MLGTRRTRGLIALVLLIALSGCLGGFGGLDDSELDETPPGGSYEWNASADAHVTIHQNTTFEAVYDAEGEEVELFRRDGFGGRNPLSVSAIRYQYPNGTVIDGTTLAERGEVDQSRESVTVTFPAGNVTGDKLGVTSGGSPKRFAIPTYVEGDYEVVLPPGRRASLPVFGRVSPPADRISSPDERDRVHITVSDVTTDSVVVQFYMPRDLRILAVVLAVGGLVAAGGVVYYLRQIRELRARREEMGLDVDTEDDDFGQDPPPGMG
ncbi:DUF5803 family protein [Halobaculum sp. MBLA0143]|uniref:DUF5803 family protein n=1 Tax=Halobaculum sp. MBLA0143 TaxID=3079933 RepID=UPI003523D3E6